MFQLQQYEMGQMREAEQRRVEVDARLSEYNPLLSLGSIGDLTSIGFSRDDVKLDIKRSPTSDTGYGILGGMSSGNLPSMNSGLQFAYAQHSLVGGGGRGN